MIGGRRPQGLVRLSSIRPEPCLECCFRLSAGLDAGPHSAEDRQSGALVLHDLEAVRYALQGAVLDFGREEVDSLLAVVAQFDHFRVEVVDASALIGCGEGHRVAPVTGY